jgi:hypothetical protein
MLELEDLRLDPVWEAEQGVRGGMSTGVDEESTAKRYHSSH